VGGKNLTPFSFSIRNFRKGIGGVTEIPVKLIIVAIVSALTITAVFGALEIYSHSQTAQNAESAARTLADNIISCYSSPGNVIPTTITLRAVGLGQVNWFEIGGKLGDENWALKGTSIRWSTSGGASSLVVKDASGASIPMNSTEEFGNAGTGGTTVRFASAGTFKAVLRCYIADVNGDGVAEESYVQIDTKTGGQM